MLIRRQMERPSAHRPQVYTLPRESGTTTRAAGHARPVSEDLPFLRSKFQRDVTAMTGVPFAMGIWRESGNADTVRKTMASGRLFSTNMHEYCQSLQYLPTDVYTAICRTPPEDVVYKLTPETRLESIAPSPTSRRCSTSGSSHRTRACSCPRSSSVGPPSLSPRSSPDRAGVQVHIILELRVGRTGRLGPDSE